MDRDAIEQLLRQTIEDGKVSRSEKKDGKSDLGPTAVNKGS